MEPEGTFVGVWSVNDNGDVPPRWAIGGPQSTLKKPRGVALDPKNKELIVTAMRLNSDRPAGQATKLSRTMHDIRYDAVHDEMLVTNPFAQAILVFRGGANGEEAPIRVIPGLHERSGKLYSNYEIALVALF